MVQWEKLLKSLGFTDSEAKIYLTSLEMGPASVQDIAKKARVSRVTTYAVIESLAIQGLMSSVEKGKKKMYVSEAPERLVSFVHNRVKSMEATLREIESSLQELKLIQRGEKPIVRLFEGEEGIRAIQDDMLKTSPDVIFEMGNLDAIHSIFSNDQLKPFKEELDRRKIRTQAIYLDPKQIDHVSRNNSAARFLPNDEFSFEGDVTVYDNKVALMTFRGKVIGVLIESVELAQTMKEIFHLAWHCAIFPENKDLRKDVKA